jgi:hypothetical protein
LTPDFGVNILPRVNRIFVLLFVLCEIVVMDTASARGSEERILDSRTDGLRALPFESQKITLGEIEDIILLPWGITLPARIDTGAGMSSLDARQLSVENDTAEFQLGRTYGERRITLPVAGWRRVKTSVGSAERPVVELRICLGTKLVRTLATLADRSQMTYPFLVGRSALAGAFVVDPSRSKTERPVCPRDSLRASEPKPSNIAVALRRGTLNSLPVEFPSVIGV